MCHKDSSFLVLHIDFDRIKNYFCVKLSNITVMHHQSYILLISMLLLTTLLIGCKQRDTSMKMNEPRNIKGVVSYKRTFGDLNKLHLSAAHKIGIHPIDSRKEVGKVEDKLTEVSTNKYYHLDSLTHSIPYLVSPAHDLLQNIGSSFQDSLSAKGLNPYKVIVTSVLRTTNDVKRLRKTNVNSSLNSAHFYGTTFDVSWKRFKQVADKKGRPMQEVGSDTLKLVLSEVLRDLRKENQCYIKYELKQGCFHITAR